MENSDILSLKCPQCGATLDMLQEQKYLTCNYCKSKLLISVNIVSELNDANTIASELTLKRLQKELGCLLDLQNSLCTMIAYVKLSGSSHYKDDRDLEYFISEKFSTFAKYAMIHIMDKKPGSPKRTIFSGEPDSIKIRTQLMSSFSNEDLNSLIQKFINYDCGRSNGKENLAIAKYVSRIEELIKINIEIDEKRKQISTIKERLP